MSETAAGVILVMLGFLIGFYAGIFYMIWVLHKKKQGSPIPEPEQKAE